MKILIAEHKELILPFHDREIEILKNGLPDAEVIIYEYTEEKHQEFLELLKDADALLTAFIQIDKEVLRAAHNLQIISINADGYDIVDVDEATRLSIAVCPVGEYCAIDVAEHTIAMMLALNKNLKAYSYDVELNHNWQYNIDPVPERIGDQTLGIFGFGKVGKRVAKMAQGLGMKVIANDPFVDPEIAKIMEVELLSKEEVLRRADVVANHMNLDKSNVSYFSYPEFAMMERHPIFLNLGRGLSVDEEALADALDQGQIRGAGLDVLSGESPDLENNVLLNRPNVIITPHGGFASRQAYLDMQRITCENIVNFLTGHRERVYKLVNEV